MSFTILYAPEAIEEIRQAVLYYEIQSSGLGKRFKASLLAELNAVKANPFSRSYRYQQVRFAVVRKFPYAAHYTVDEENKIIKIQAVLHFKQDDTTNWGVRF